MELTQKIIDKFWLRANKSTAKSCWIWSGKVDNHGYGVLHLCVEGNTRKGIYLLAHRISWAIHYGQIHDGFLVCHHCDVPLCVNPYHLFAGTNADNIHDMIDKGRAAFQKKQTMLVRDRLDLPIQDGDQN